MNPYVCCLNHKCSVGFVWEPHLTPFFSANGRTFTKWLNDSAEVVLDQ